MRALVQLVLVGVSASALARPTVRPPIFSASEALRFLAPEVGAVVGRDLVRAGFSVGASGEIPIVGQLNELDGERVRLTARAGSQIVTVDGTLETVDVAAGALAGRLVPALDRAGKGAKAAAPRTLAVRDARRPHAHVEPESPAAKIEVAAPTVLASSAPPHVEVKPPDPPAAAPPPSVPAEPREAKEPPVAPPSLPTLRAPDPSAYPPAFTRPLGGLARGRVVAHAVVDLPSAYPSSGNAATQALFNFLTKRMHMQLVPTGVGLSSPQVAADEAWRAGTHAVVMARLEGIEFLPSQLGPGVRCRLEIVVVRDGQMVLRRVLDSQPIFPTHRPREADLLYRAVTTILDAVIADLATALDNAR